MESINKNHWIHWNMSGEEILEETKKLVRKSATNNKFLLEQNIDTIENRRKFLEILSDDITEYTIFHSMCSFLQFVSPDVRVRKNSSYADLMLTEYVNELNLNQDIYEKIIKFKNNCSDEE